MAKVTYGSIVRRISGKIGNQIYSSCGRVEYIKNYIGPPTDPQSDRQLEVRQIFSDLNTYWQGMSESQKSLWHHYATLELGRGDGINLFLRHNLRLLLSKNVSLTQIDTPPLQVAPVKSLTAFAVDVQTDKNIISWTHPEPSVYYYTQVFFRLKKPNTQNLNIYWNLIDTVPLSDGDLEHIHGFTSGTVLFYRIRVIDTSGRITPWLSSIRVVTE